MSYVDELADLIAGRLAELEDDASRLRAALAALEDAPETVLRPVVWDTKPKVVRLPSVYPRVRRDPAAADDVIALLATGMTGVHQIAIELGVSWQSVGRRLRELRASGDAVRDERSRWRLTNPGNWVEYRAREIARRERPEEGVAS